MLHELKAELRGLEDPRRAEILKRFFKTGPGEYGEGDVFLGIPVPSLRKVAAAYRAISLDETGELLHSPIHEERLTALLILVDRFRKGDASVREQIFSLYLANAAQVNNWDLVDCSAEQIVGAFLEHRPKKMLYRLALSANLWERRIAIIATFRYIKAGKPHETLKIAQMLLEDRHDLIRKAVGWMLREVGKRCSEQELERFLRRHHRDMSRVTLRYAIERLPEERRRAYLS